MGIFETIIIAIVEGLTEFLPVSSTGHMIIAQNVLGVESTDFVKAFTFIIQFGAILSVICLYWKRFFRLNDVPSGVSGKKAFLIKYEFYWKLLVAFIPAAVLGLLFSDAIDAILSEAEICTNPRQMLNIRTLLSLEAYQSRMTQQQRAQRNEIFSKLFDEVVPE